MSEISFPVFYWTTLHLINQCTTFNIKNDAILRIILPWKGQVMCQASLSRGLANNLWALVVAQLAERSFQTPEVRSSNPIFILKINLLSVNSFEKTKIKKKMPGMFKKTIYRFHSLPT